MRKIAFMPVLLLAACSGGTAEKNEAGPAAANIGAGQWELASEVTSFNKVDDGEPQINTPVGTRATESVCVGSDERPLTAFFAGPGYDCSYGSYYVRNGRINVTLTCSRAGLEGQIPIAAEGRVQADGTVEFNRTTRTILASDGDVEIATRVTGRRTADCTPEAAGDNEAAPQ